MTATYEAPDPKIAEIVHRTNAECDRQQERLESASVAELKAVLRDRTESTAARGAAYSSLLKARAADLADLQLELLDDPDQKLWRMAALCLNLRDPRILAKLQQFLDDDNEDRWSTAAVALSRKSDETLLPRFAEWLRHGDRPHQNVAVQCLRLHKSETAKTVLRDVWTSGGWDQELRLVIAAALLDLGDDGGKSLLADAARQGAGSWSVFAATSIYLARREEGLEWMLHVLDHGDLEARQAMVNQIWNFAHLPHAFTADGCAEARLWVEQQLSRQGPGDLY